MTLRVDGLACGRAGQPVIEGLSFAVQDGTVLILRGPNGAGKTTLLRCLAGLTPPLAGTIDLEPESAAYASHLDGAKTTLTVAENLAFWADLHGRPWDDDALDAFDLRALRDRPAATLSAGQARRLGLARLAVIGRRVLLLDEPTSSLDAASTARLLSWLTDRHLKPGGSAVIAAHGPLALDAPELDLAPYRALASSAGRDDAFL